MINLFIKKYSFKLTALLENLPPEIILEIGKQLLLISDVENFFKMFCLSRHLYLTLTLNWNFLKRKVLENALGFSPPFSFLEDCSLRKFKKTVLAIHRLKKSGYVYLQDTHILRHCRSLEKKYTNLEDALTCHWDTLQEMNEDLRVFMYKNLKSLDCSSKDLAVLPPLPHIQNLNCANNNLTSLIGMPHLQFLDCSGNLLSSIPTFPKLSCLDCSLNNLEELQTQPSCIELMCHFNLLTSLPELPALKVLNCSVNNLFFLPEFYSATHINCSDNNLILFPDSCQSLKNLDCSNNNLLSLPSNLIQLENLDCSYNHLQDLPLLPQIIFLNITGNDITEIDRHQIPNVQYLKIDSHLDNFLLDFLEE